MKVLVTCDGCSLLLRFHRLILPISTNIIYTALKKNCTPDVMLCLSKVMLHPCLVTFVHRVRLATLLLSPKSVKIPTSLFISFRKFYKSNMFVCLSTLLLDHSITFVCEGNFLQSIGNVRACQLGTTINITYCLIYFNDST